MTKTATLPRARYTLEFKQEAVRLVEGGPSIAGAARTLARALAGCAHVAGWASGESCCPGVAQAGECREPVARGVIAIPYTFTACIRRHST